jgi:hypothetical protein
MLQYHGNDISNLHGFVDMDWVVYVDKGKSTIRYVFNLFGGALTWMSKGNLLLPYLV